MKKNEVGKQTLVIYFEFLAFMPTCMTVTVRTRLLVLNSGNTPPTCFAPTYSGINCQYQPNFQITMLKFIAIAVLFVVWTVSARVDEDVDYPSHLQWSPLSSPQASKLHDSQLITLDIALAISKVKAKVAIQLFNEMTDPESKMFGRHLKPREAASILGQSTSEIGLVLMWLTDSGLSADAIRVLMDCGHIHVNITISQARELLKTDFYQYQNGSVTRVASDIYKVPHSIAKLVDYILPIHRYRGLSVRNAERLPEQNPYIRHIPNMYNSKIDCFKSTTPGCLRLLYNVSEEVDSVPFPNNSIGIFQTSGAAWLADDLDTFFAEFHSNLVGQRPRLLPVDGGYIHSEEKSSRWNLEANLDFQYTMSLAHPIPSIDIQVSKINNPHKTQYTS